MTEQTQTATTVSLRRTFDAPRERVFEAWTRPEQLQKWFRPGDDFTTPIAEVDVRAGGKYRIGMHHTAKEETHVCYGEYREVIPPRRLVFTWSWEEGMAVGETLVTVEFHEKGEQTEVVLVHELFPAEAMAAEHNKGWTGCLGQLARYVEA